MRSLHPSHRRRPRFGRRHVQPLFGAALAFTVTIAPVPAAASDPLSSVRSLVSGTAASDLTSDQGRFVALWDARFRSGEAFQAYLDSDQQYDDGYNDRSPEEQASLVRALVEHWRATDSGFAEYVDWQPAEPTEIPGEESARPNVDQVLMTVDAIIFHKEEFKEKIRGGEEGAGSETPAGTPQKPDTAALDPLGEQALAALDAATAQAAAVMDALSMLEGAADQTLAPVADQLRDVARPDVLDRLPTAGDVAGIDFGEASDVLDAALEPLPELSPPPADLAVPASLDLGLENLVYGVCWQLTTTTEQCTGNVYVVGVLTQVPGQAAGFDVDNNLFTGQLGVDLEVGLVIDPLTTPGGLGATVTVKRYGTAATNAKGYVRYLLPGSDKEVRVGFDGLVHTLQPQQSAAVTFEDIAAMSASDLRLKATVSHTGTPGGPTVELITDFVSGLTTDALVSRTRFTRAPTTHSTRLVLKRSGTTALVHVESGHAGAALPDVRVDATARLAALRLVGSATLTGVPNTTTVTAVTNDSTNATNVTYDASGQLARLQAGVSVTPDVAAPGNYYTAALDVDRLPAQMSLAVQHGQTAYNASSAIGSGAGLALEATVEEYKSNVVERRAHAGLSSVPTTVAITRTPSAQRYVVDSPGPITTVQAAYYDRPQRLNALVTVTGFPGHAELTMPTASDPRIAWTASAPTTSVSASGTFGVWSAGLTVTNVPTSMTIVPGTTNLDVTTTGSAAASVTAYLTNTGSYAVGPTGDNYATLVSKRLTAPMVVPGGTITKQLSASLAIAGITKVNVTPGATTTFDVRAGGGEPLYLLVRIEDVPANRRSYATARIVNFPGVLTGSIGTTTTLSASSNADLTAYAEQGPLVTHAALPSVHGVVARRTLTGGVPTTRAHVWLTGLPTWVVVSPGSLYFGGLRPSQPSLTVDVQLLNNAAAPVTALATLAGIPTGTPHTITVTWGTTQIAGGYRTTAKATTSGASFGALSVSVGYGQYGATLSTSALPRSIDATITEVEGATTFAWSANSPITRIDASMLARAVPSSPFAARGSLVLTDVPSSFTLTTGRDGGGTGPLLTYNANAGTLDAEVVADGSLKTSNTSIGANVYFKLVNLATSVSVAKAGAGFALGGAGRTARIEARVSARANYTKSGSGTANPASWVKFPWSYSVEVDAIVRNLSFTLTDAASFAVDAGLVSRLAGDFGTFDLRWDSFAANVKAQGSLKAELDLWVCKCKFTVFSAAFSQAFMVNPSVRLYQEGWQNIFNVHVNFFCAYLDFGVRTRPLPIGTTSLVGGITLNGVPGTTRTYWATPVVLGWNRLSDIVTGISVYGGSFVQGWFQAKWTCW